MVSRCYAFTPEPTKDTTSSSHTISRNLLGIYSNQTIPVGIFSSSSNNHHYHHYHNYTYTAHSELIAPRSRRRLSSSVSVTTDNTSDRSNNSSSSSTSSTESLFFQPRACMGKCEKLLPLREAFAGEAQALRECGGPSFSKFFQSYVL